MKTVKMILFMLIAARGLFYIASPCYAQSPWTQKADMPAARAGHSSIVLDGKIYAIGGANINSAPASKTMQVYDPILNSWTYKANMVAGRANFPVCVVNGKIWAIGGASLLWYNSIKSIEEYDPATDTWTYITDMQEERQGHTASLVGDKIYIIGGGETYESALARIDVYDTLTHTWSTGADMLTPRIYLSIVVLDGKIYAIGGNKGTENNEIPTTTVEVYDPATDTWTPKADMNQPRKYLGACVLNNKIYVFGGKGGGHGNCVTWPWHVEVYDPVTDTWTEASKTPTRVLVGHSVVPFNDKIYVSGGIMHDNSTVCNPNSVKTVYEYNPDQDTLGTGVEWRRIGQQPEWFTLYQNYPNPFNPTTTIRFELPKSAFISLKIFDLLGREIITLVNEKRPAGEYAVEWNGKGLPSGIYLYRLKADDPSTSSGQGFTETRKLVLHK
jgi:N-acetylneuraminic acid mutarotase